MTRFLCARCGQPKELMHVTCRQCEETMQDRIYELEKLWQEFLVNEHCGLCGNQGRITLRTSTAAGVELKIDGLPCICPNGRAIKEKMA